LFSHGLFSLIRSGLGNPLRACVGSDCSYDGWIIGIIFLLFLVVLVVEGYVILAFNEAVGGWNTIGLIVLTSMVGAWLVRREGLSVLRRAQLSLDKGQIPTNELINGVLLLVAAALILTPGFFTAGIGLLLLFPPTRAVVREVLKRRFAGRVARGGTIGGSGGIRFGQWTDVSGTDVTDVGEARYGGSAGEAIELGPVSDTNPGAEADDPDDPREQR